MSPSKHRMDKLISSIYDAAADVIPWQASLEELANISRADAAALVVHELGPESHAVAASWMLDPAGTRLYHKHYGSLDVWAMRAQLMPPNRACTSESLCSATELANSEFYNDFLIPQNIVHGAFGLLTKDLENRWSSISLYRGRSSKEFSPSDLATLNFLIPHAQRAFRLHALFSELKGRNEGLEAALNLLTTGIMFVGSKGEIILMNRLAEDLVLRKDGLLLIHSRLSSALPVESNRLRSVIASAIQTSDGKSTGAGGTILISRNVGRPLTITVAPLRDVNMRLGKRPCAVVLISNPDQNIELPSDLLKRCYGLTAAEARLAITLLEGHTLKSAADLCGVTHNTVRSQLKSVFTKTQVQRQGELIKLLMPLSFRLTR